MSCVLRIEGANFNIDEFLNSIDLTPYKKHRKGDIISFIKKKETIHKTSGCSFDLSFADFNQFELQKKDTTKFLKDNFDKLKNIYSFGLSKNETPIIDFAIENQLNKSAVQFNNLGVELIKLVGNLDFAIEISLYNIASDKNKKNK